MPKTEFRTKYKTIRNNISHDDAYKKSFEIFKKLVDSGLINDSKNVFLYLSYGREVNTSFLVDYLFDANKTILIPKCDVNSETMIPVVYLKDDLLTDNFYGIKETDSQTEYTGNVDVVIVPGIAFDKFGNRIGHGKGYYDKYLANKNILKIGLCYSQCFSETEIPHDANDIVMDYIITDREVVKIKP